MSGISVNALAYKLELGADAWGALTFTSSGSEVGFVKLGACGVRVTRGARSPSPVRDRRWG